MSVNKDSVSEKGYNSNRMIRKKKLHAVWQARERNVQLCEVQANTLFRITGLCTFSIVRYSRD
jgi:hypothetical protein